MSAIPAAIPVTEARVLELDPATVFTPESNRQPTLESVTDLLASEREYGQLVLGIVALHPTRPGCWLALDGNRRLLVSRILGIKFRAVEHEGEVTEERLAITRIAANNIRQNMTDAEVAEDLQRIIDARDCSQAEAGRIAGLSAGEVSKIMSFPRRAITELLAAAEARAICRDGARIIARLPVEMQREALDRAIKHTMKRDAIETMCKALLGKKGPKAPPFKARVAGFLIDRRDAPPDKLPELLRALRDRLTEALKQVDKDPRLISVLPKLLAG